MSEGAPRGRRGRRLLVFVLGIGVGVAGAIYLPAYLPSGPWRGERVEGTVLEKRREEGRLLLRVSTDQGLMLATFSQKREEIDLLVERNDVVTLDVEKFAPFAEDPELLSVKRPTEPPPAAGGSERAEVLEQLEAQLAEWEWEIDSLRERAAKSGEGARAQSAALLQRLHEQRIKARERLSGLADSSGDAWEELESGVERAWSELEAALAEARKELAPADEP